MKQILQKSYNMSGMLQSIFFLFIIRESTQQVAAHCIELFPQLTQVCGRELSGMPFLQNTVNMMCLLLMTNSSPKMLELVE